MAENAVFDRIQGEIETNPVMLYMKGTPMFPQCGFSARVVQILSHLGVPFKSANVLEDRNCARASRSSRQWPTIPQLYVRASSSAAAIS